MRNPFKGAKPVTYSCYYLTLHFASAEEAARFAIEKNLIQPGIELRLKRGGDTLPRCVV